MLKVYLKIKKYIDAGCDGYAYNWELGIGG
jgi:hypothetical protein